ncbi:MAG: hypothetical protein HC820_05840 [Hydrococcus sp. RM1_1_31]|nr:hypothetical protein [Hydrococcus sp. RM1_1_31]
MESSLVAIAISLMSISLNSIDAVFSGMVAVAEKILFFSIDGFPLYLEALV